MPWNEVMSKFKAGTLRSGGNGSKVTNPKQAIAIQMSEKKKADEGDSEYMAKTEHVNLGHKGSFSVKKGALHQMLGIPEGEKIPASKLQSHPGDSSLLKRRKASAKGLKAMHHG